MLVSLPLHCASVNRQSYSGVRRLLNDQQFIVVHDYQHGAVVLKILADSRSQVEDQLTPPTWITYEIDDPIRPRWDHEPQIPFQDIRNPTPELQTHIYSQARQNEGKQGYFFSTEIDGTTHYRQNWARSQEEILDRFPKLQSLVGVPMTPEHIKKMGYSDIDVQDSFLQRL